MDKKSRIQVRMAEQGDRVNAELHGQFIEHLGTCIDGGIWVGTDSDIPNYDGLRKDLVDVLADLELPILRWPGGCFADMYHWRDGIGPRETRPVTFNSNFGTNMPENHQFGLHEFMRLCKAVKAQPWLNINMLSGSVAEMVEWAEYCNRPDTTTLAKERAQNGDAEPFNVEYWGIGNEAWAGGGFFTAQSYADTYRKFASAFPSFPIGDGRNNLFPPCHPIKLIAVGPDGNKPKERVEWTTEFFKAMQQFRMPRMSAYDLHFYNWNSQKEAGTVTEFTTDEWYRLIDGAQELEFVIEQQYELIQQHLPKGDGGPFSVDPKVDLIVGEWGNWHPFDTKSALWQQNTLRDAITYALTLDIFHRNCDKVKLACLAQSVNVLGALVLTEGDKTILTPTYHLFQMYKPHRDGIKVACTTDSERLYSGIGDVRAINAFASVKAGVLTLSVVNTDIENAVETQISFDGAVQLVGGTQLTHEDPAVCNSVENPTAITPKKVSGTEATSTSHTLIIPAKSINVYQFKIC